MITYMFASFMLLISAVLVSAQPGPMILPACSANHTCTVFYAPAFSGDGSQLTGVSAGVESINSSLTGAGTVASPLGVNSSSVAVLSSGFVVNSQLDPSSVTKQGNAFNGNSQLVQLTAAGKLPVLDGSNLTNVTASVGNTLTSSFTVTGAGGILSRSSVTASAFFGDGSHLTGITASFSGGTVSNETDFLSSVTFQGAGGIKVIYGITAATGTFTTNAVINGTTFFGAQTNTALRTLACPVIPCQANSSTDFDIYTATATSAGSWRNSRTGTPP